LSTTPCRGLTAARGFLRMKKKYFFALSAGHACADMNQGALPVMLPFLIVASGMGYAQAGGLAFAIAIASTSTQPLFGIIADKFSKAWVVPAGVLLSGIGLALIGLLSHQYWLMFAAALLSGIGVAAFHPEGARFANRLSGSGKKGSAMSIFSVGGAIGVAAGPLIAMPALYHLGLGGSAVLAVPGIIMCALLFLLIPGMRRLAEANEIEERKAEETLGERRNEWVKFSLLCLAITSKSIIAHSLNTFLPLYWLNVLGQSMAASAIVVTFMISAGIIVNIASGYLADRFGIHKIVKLGWLLLIPSLFFFTDITSPALALLMLLPIAVGSYIVVAPLIVLAQQCLPKNVGFGSGIILALSGSVGGLVTPSLGFYADIHGLPAAFRLLAILPLIGAAVAFAVSRNTMQGKKNGSNYG